MDIDLTSIQFPMPPRPDVILLGSGEPVAMNARLHVSHDMREIYAQGYRWAAERLIEWINQNPVDLNFTVYPIVFLYRHHLELRLKDILDLHYQLGARPTPAPNAHDLLKLWSECKRELKARIGKGHDAWFASVTRCIEQLDSVDPDGQSFRYPEDIGGAKSVELLSHINLAGLRETMDAILDWLYGASCVLSESTRNGSGGG